MSHVAAGVSHEPRGVGAMPWSHEPRGANQPLQPHKLHLDVERSRRTRFVGASAEITHDHSMAERGARDGYLF